MAVYRNSLGASQCPPANALKVTVSLHEHLLWAALLKAFPPSAVNEVLRDCGRLGRRRRELPAAAVFYVVIALRLFHGAAGIGLLGLLGEAVRWRLNGIRLRLVNSSSLSRARARLGSEPLRKFRRRAVQSLASEESRLGRYGSRQILRLESELLGVPDTKYNRSIFGESSGGQPPTKQARISRLVETVTRASVAWEWGAASESAGDQTARLGPRLPPGSLVLGNTDDLKPGLWKALSATGAELLFRNSEGSTEPQLESLSDRSFRSTFDGQPVRVFSYGIEGADGPPVRLVTTLQDANSDSARRLARVDHDHCLDQGAPGGSGEPLLPPVSMLRSRTPRLVAQELEGMLLADYAVRSLLLDGLAWDKPFPRQLRLFSKFRIQPPQSDPAGAP